MPTNNIFFITTKSIVAYYNTINMKKRKDIKLTVTFIHLFKIITAYNEVRNILIKERNEILFGGIQ